MTCPVSGRVGFVGLGIMGSGMARNLLAAGHELVVWNRTRERMRPLADAGAETATSPADLASQVDVVFVCVSDTPDVEEVLLGADGVVHGASEGTLVVDTSTISPEVTRRIADRLAESGIRMIDAPVSGGSEGAEQGTLSVMVGGDDHDVERARPYLETVSSRMTHVGGHGAGQAAKLCNQILVVTTMLGVSEAFVFAAAQGLDLQRVWEAVRGGAAGSWMLENRGPQVLARDWRPGFTIDLQQKDLRLVLQAADDASVPAVATGLVFQFYRTLQAAGLGHEGNHALVQAIETLAGITVGGRTGR
jgi:3-hydroxyisobutyrate dehydrogenase